jgi:probable phosphomutase (TIGR03848 family)
VKRVPTVIFVRHGRSSANTSGTLAGWTPGVFLDDTGEAQAAAVGARLAAGVVPVVEVVSSPLDRCVQTADLLCGALPGPVARSVHEGLAECKYGAWTGRRLTDLVKEDLWKVVQDEPSAARFPDSEAYPGESMLEMQDRALRAVREVDARILELHGPDAVWIAVSHGDVIKSVLSHATGAHLDDFQRIHVDPASVSAVRYTSRKPFVLRLNDVGGDLSGLRPPEREAATEGDAEVGGGAGPAPSSGTGRGDEVG